MEGPNSVSPETTGTWNTTSQEMVETGTRERNNDRSGVTQVEVMVEEGMSENNDDTRVVPTHSRKTSKTKVTGEKRKRHCFSPVLSSFLEVELIKDNLDSQEGRQKVTDDFTKETKEHFDVDRIHTWFRNHKSKKKGGGGKGGRMVKVRDNGHLSHGEIVLVMNDDDIVV
jgi:hypothetical protein